jgi:hypothetical protein
MFKNWLGHISFKFRGLRSLAHRTLIFLAVKLSNVCDAGTSQTMIANHFW